MVTHHALSAEGGGFGQPTSYSVGERPALKVLVLHEFPELTASCQIEECLPSQEVHHLVAEETAYHAVFKGFGVRLVCRGVCRIDSLQYRQDVARNEDAVDRI